MSIVGKYALTGSENFDEYMAAIGVSYITRKIANNLKPTTEIEKAGDQFTIKQLSTFKNSAITFKLGEKFKENTADGRTCDTIITMESEKKMQHKQLCTNGMELVVDREFTPDGMVVTLHGPKEKPVVCKRYYKKFE